MEDAYNSQVPSTQYLKKRARWRIPGFAYDYLEAGCFADINRERNRSEIKDIQLKPWYLREYAGADMSCELFGKTYDAPFGVAPVGLQGLMWPGSCEILAKAAKAHNIPFTLSTVSTASVEDIAEITDGEAWFQLYHPAEDELRDKLLDRVWESGIRTLVILADTPTFAYRPREIRNGLSIPPQMSLRNVLQMLGAPLWCLGQLKHGKPEFKTMTPYIPPGLSMKHLGLFMNKTFNGRLTEEKIKAIRDKWKGNLVVKGLVNEEDVDKALAAGIDGFFVSNHGGRQLDNGESTIVAMTRLAKTYGDKTTVMIDGGVQEGPDIACAIASGAKAAFMGRTFMYSVCALGDTGGEHAMIMLKRQLQQVMQQIGCEKIEDLPRHLIESE
jgi:L-lactate dehydrogenase (cytochrome)